MNELSPAEIQICHHKQAPWLFPCGCHTCTWCGTPVLIGRRWCLGCWEKKAQDIETISDEELPEDAACSCGSYTPCLSPMIRCFHPMRHDAHPDQLMAKALGVCWHSPTADRWPCGEKR